MKTRKYSKYFTAAMKMNESELSEADRMLFRSIYLCEIDRVRQALKMGADPSIYNAEIGKRPIHLAAQIGSSEIVKELLKDERVEVDYEDALGQHALDIARIFNHKEIESLLVEHVYANPKRYDIFLEDKMYSRFGYKFIGPKRLRSASSSRARSRPAP